MRTSRLGCVSLVIAVLMLALPVCAQAQAAQFSYVQLTLGGNFAHPANVAVDASGNIFVADAGNSAVKEIPAGCITSTCVVPLGSGFNGPNGVAVDASGNVIVGDTLNNAVKVILAVNGSIPAISPTINPLGGGFAAPAGVAKDASGNVYVSDFGNSAVKLIPPGCGDATCVKTLANISYPNGIAVDGSGNVFVTSAISNAVYEILAVNGSIPATLPTINPLGSGFSYPNGATVDASGNVYVADSGNNALKVILAVNGSIPATSPTIITLDSNLYWPTGVVLDASGIIYVADYKNDRVLELKTRVVNFGTVATSQTSTALSLTFTFNSAGTIAAPVALTQGAPGLDFAVASGGTCTTGSTYNIGDT
jgi:sugar lactone lactonase YvrE